MRQIMITDIWNWQLRTSEQESVLIASYAQGISSNGNSLMNNSKTYIKAEIYAGEKLHNSSFKSLDGIVIQ